MRYSLCVREVLPEFSVICPRAQGISLAACFPTPCVDHLIRSQPSSPHVSLVKITVWNSTCSLDISTWTHHCLPLIDPELSPASAPRPQTSVSYHSPSWSGTTFHRWLSAKMWTLPSTPAFPLIPTDQPLGLLPNYLLPLPSSGSWFPWSSCHHGCLAFLENPPWSPLVQSFHQPWPADFTLQPE